jgi:serine/threonine-protein kinase
MAMDETSKAQENPRSTDGDGDFTAPNTTERSLWRAATVVADKDEHVESVREEGPVIGAGARYDIREILGTGGMGEVRLCRDETIGRDVALKTLHEDRAASGPAQRRFLREVRVQGQLEHPSIVPVYDLGTSPDGGLFFTMRRVRGRTLADLIAAIARGDAAEPGVVAGYSRRKLLDAFVRVCLAVDYAHARGVLHRDLKPSNIMLGDFGEVYLLDWGVARLVTDRATEAPVEVQAPPEPVEGSPVGTIGYMSPEQLKGARHEEDARTDVYALGAVLFEILTLRRLHEGRTFQALAQSTLERRTVLPSSVADDVPPELDAVCEKAAAWSREARYASARELADAVERYLDGDRDLERRRAQSSERAKVAADAFARLAVPDATEEAASLARADAVREVSAALALDPENAEARGLLIRLFVEAPSRMPREVESEIAAATHRSREQFMRFGTYGLVSWLLCIPLVIAMGVLSWTPVLFSSGLTIALSVLALWSRKQRNFSQPRMFGLMVLLFATAASVTCWLGPFVVVPQACAAAALWISLMCQTRQERWVVLTTGVLTVLLPFALELLGAFPPAYVFHDGALILSARAIRLSPERTLPMLVWASATFVVMPGLITGGVRDALSAAERQLFLQAWHLRQLVRDNPATSS